jgi:CBS domain-containing protein
MTVNSICCREVDLAEKEETAQAAGRRMAARNVGTLVIVDADERPVGIVTDRDLALRVVGMGRDPSLVLVGEVMTSDPVTVPGDAPVLTALERMRGLGVRRMPVVGPEGRLAGILSMDDVLEHLATELRAVGGIIEGTTARE